MSTPSEATPEEVPVHTGTFLGVITAGSHRTEHVKSLLALATTPTLSPVTHTYIHVGGPYLDDNRNKVVEAFLKSPCEHLFFLDSDVEITVEDVRKLVDATDELSPVVGGIYYSGGMEVGVLKSPVVYDVDVDRAWSDGGPFQILTVDDIEDHQLTCPDIPFSCGCVGTGAMVIHRSLLEKMIPEYGYPCPWFAEEIVNGTHCGEDMIFCLRVIAMGFKVYAHPGVHPNHYKVSRY